MTSRASTSPLLALALVSPLACGAARRSVGACVNARAPGESAADDAPPPRRPDAVLLDPPPALPAPEDQAHAAGVVELREPLRADAVRAVVHAVVGAWVSESLDGLVALLSEDAGPIEARARGRGALIEGWQQRLHAHEYQRLAGVDLVHPERIERYTWDDLSRWSRVPRPADMRKNEILVRVPLEVTRVAGERVFGDFILLLLRRENGAYRVTAYGET